MDAAAVVLVVVDEAGNYLPAITGANNDGDRTDWEASTFSRREHALLAVYQLRLQCMLVPYHDVFPQQ